MTSKRYLGNIISATPVTPADQFEDSAASGVWSVTEANTYRGANQWPTQGLRKAFDGSRIFIPYYSTTYTSDHKVYNFNTNTITSLGTSGTNYMAGVGGSGYISVAMADGGKIVALASAAGTGTYSNMAYVSTGNSASYYHMDPQNYPTYGSYFGQVTYNPDAGRWQTTTYPHYNQGNSCDFVTFTTSGSSTTYGGGLPGHQSSAPLFRMYERDSLGNPTFGDYMIEVGAQWGTGRQTNVFRDQDPYTTPSFTGTALGTSQSYIRVRGAAPINKDVCMILTGGYGDFIYTPASDSATTISDFNGDLNTAAGAYPGKRNLTQLAEGVLCASENTASVVFKTDTSFNISWAVDVYGALGGAGSLEMVIGAGSDMYVWHRDTSSPYQHYMTRFTFDLDTGSYTKTTNTLSGLTANKGFIFVSYDYFD
jgi:hypothetical protein